MHAEALEWVGRYATTEPVAVLDLGGRNVNGSPRHLFPAADPYVSLDIEPGRDVQVVADAATWKPDRAYDVVVCTEVFEHTFVWPQICVTAYSALRPGGRLIATMAGPGRLPHSAFDGGPHLYAGEHYGNVEPLFLNSVLKVAGFTDVVVDQLLTAGDVRATAVR
jgi:SAM-dependent methyltransferase